jgi:hypothetical protein
MKTDRSAEDGSSSSVIPAPGGNPGCFPAGISLDTRPFDTAQDMLSRASRTEGYLLQVSAPLFCKEFTKEQKIILTLMVFL